MDREDWEEMALEELKRIVKEDRDEVTLVLSCGVEKNGRLWEAVNDGWVALKLDKFVLRGGTAWFATHISQIVGYEYIVEDKYNPDDEPRRDD